MRFQDEQLRSPWISKIPTQLFRTGWERGRTGRRIKDLLNLDTEIRTWESLLAHPAAWGKSQGRLLQILIPNKKKCPTTAAAPAPRETQGCRTSMERGYWKTQNIFCLMTGEMWELPRHWIWEEMEHDDTGLAMVQLE